MRERVVITGVGVVSPLGRGADALWSAVMDGRSGISRRSEDDSAPLAGQLAATVPESLLYQPFRDPAGRPLTGRAAAVASLAARDALASAGTVGREVDLVVGTTMGEPTWIDTWPDIEAARSPPPPDRAVELLSGAPDGLASAIADASGVTGRVSAVGGACAAGNYALARALDEVRAGRSKRVLAGGVDAFSRTAFLGFAKLGALASSSCQPFGLDRDGLVLAEGGAFLLVEAESSAQRRGAPVLAELVGAGLSCDASHPTSPHPEGRGATEALHRALEDAAVKAGDVDWVSAHGTGTKANDRTEVIALGNVFPDVRPPISSLKSLTGHGLGAASAIEAVLCVLALQHQTVPPTWYVDDQDPDCDWDIVADGPRPAALNVVVNEAYAFGGCNAVTVLASPGSR